MTKEAKELLLKDLCARLTYGVIGVYSFKGNEPYGRELTGCLYDELHSSLYSTEDSNFSPYLRSMNTMTEEEKEKLISLCTLSDETDSTDWIAYGVKIIDTHPIYGDYYLNDYAVIDWLNKNMFDYRGLIQTCLALEAPDGMYKKGNEL